MPTLIRLVIFLIVLAAIAFGGMVALTILVDPVPKEVRYRVPVSAPGAESQSNDPLGLRPPAVEPEPEPAPEPAAEAPPSEDGVRTVDIPE